MSILIPPAPIGAPFADYSWLDWYQKVRRAINDVNSLNHNDLQNIQGGNVTERYHLTQAEYNSVGLTLVLSSDFTNGTTTSLDVADLQFTPDADSTYVFDAYLSAKSAVITNGVRTGWLFTTGVSSGVVEIVASASTLGTTSKYGNHLSADNGRSNHAMVSPSQVADTNEYMTNMRGVFRTNSSPQTMGITLASEGLVDVTLVQGSTLIVRKVA